jgi:hypothetical protein
MDNKEGSFPSEIESVNGLSKPSKNADYNVDKKTKDKTVKWSPENEEILVEWCDIAKIYKWLNSKENAKLSRQHAWFTIPTITLSTITGTASFAQASLPLWMQTYSPAVIGSINICIGILSTVQQYLKISELNEAHRVSAIAWDKFARNIKIELAKDPSERTDAGQFSKLCRMEYDRLMETSPPISQSIVDAFSRNFKGKVGSVEREHYDELRKPDICNNIITADKFRHQWYRHINQEFDAEDDIEMQRNITCSIKERLEVDEIKLAELIKLKEAKELEDIQQKQLEMLKEQELKLQEDAIEREIFKIKEYIIEFEVNAGRDPLIDEIISNMQGTVSDDALQMYADTIYTTHI